MATQVPAWQVEQSGAMPASSGQVLVSVLQHWSVTHSPLQGIDTGLQTHWPFWHISLSPQQIAPQMSCWTGQQMRSDVHCASRQQIPPQEMNPSSQQPSLPHWSCGQQPSRQAMSSPVQQTPLSVHWPVMQQVDPHGLSPAPQHAPLVVHCPLKQQPVPHGE